MQLGIRRRSRLLLEALCSHRRDANRIFLVAWKESMLALYERWGFRILWPTDRTLLAPFLCTRKLQCRCAHVQISRRRGIERSRWNQSHLRWQAIRCVLLGPGGRAWQHTKRMRRGPLLLCLADRINVEVIAFSISWMTVTLAMQPGALAPSKRTLPIDLRSTVPSHTLRHLLFFTIKFECLFFLCLSNLARR